MDREKVITAAIVAGLFGGLVGGPVASLSDYYAPPERRFWLFMIPEIIGFICAGLMVAYAGRSRKKGRILDYKTDHIVHSMRNIFQ